MCEFSSLSKFKIHSLWAFDLKSKLQAQGRWHKKNIKGLWAQPKQIHFYVQMNSDRTFSWHLLSFNSTPTASSVVYWSHSSHQCGRHLAPQGLRSSTRLIYFKSRQSLYKSKWSLKCTPEDSIKILPLQKLVHELQHTNNYQLKKEITCS